MMNERWNMQTISDIRGTDVYSADGEKIGSVKDIYYDETSGTPEWVGLGMGFLGMKHRVIPVEVLTTQGDHLAIPFTKDKVANEPDFEGNDDYLTDEDEMKLVTYFGLTGNHQHATRLMRPDETFGGRMP
jgi:sporulation protein YlmC with PRC-barrel domain